MLHPTRTGRQKREAHFRYHMARVRDNAEAIALDRAQEVEHFQLDNKLNALLESKYALVKRETRLTWFTNFFNNLSALFPYLLDRTHLQRQCSVF